MRVAVEPTRRVVLDHGLAGQPLDVVEYEQLARIVEVQLSMCS